MIKEISSFQDIQIVLMIRPSTHRFQAHAYPVILVLTVNNIIIIIRLSRGVAHL